MQNRQSAPPVTGFDCTIGHSRHPEAHLHRHDLFEVGWCDSGHGVLLVEGRSERYAAPCVALVAAGARHFHHSAPGSTSRWRFLFLDLPRLLPPGVVAHANQPCPAVQTPASHAASCGPLQLLMEGFARHGARLDPVWAGGLAQALLAALAQLPSQALPLGRNPLEPALRLLAARGGAVRIGDMAQSCGLAASSFREAFARAYGLAPKRFLDRWRCDLAAAALLSQPQRRVSDLALDCGFADLSTFNRSFRVHLGMSPRQWRMQGAGR